MYFISCPHCKWQHHIRGKFSDIWIWYLFIWKTFLIIFISFEVQQIPTGYLFYIWQCIWYIHWNNNCPSQVLKLLLFFFFYYSLLIRFINLWSFNVTRSIYSLRNRNYFVWIFFRMFSIYVMLQINSHIILYMLARKGIFLNFYLQFTGTENVFFGTKFVF